MAMRAYYRLGGTVTAAILTTGGGSTNATTGLIISGNEHSRPARAENPLRMWGGMIYPEAKRASEALPAAYRSAHRLYSVTVRPFAFMGPYQSLTAPWAVLQDALDGGPIRILGNAATVRSYQYPADMAVWMLPALVRGRTGSAYNLGSEHAVTLCDLAERIAGHAGGRSEVTEGGPGRRHAEPSRFVPDTHSIREELGVSETVDLDAAIRPTLAWHGTAGGGRHGRGEAAALRPVRTVDGSG